MERGGYVPSLSCRGHYADLSPILSRITFILYDNFEFSSSCHPTPLADPHHQGAASDVPIHLYTLSSELDPSFTHSHGTSTQIKAYWARLCTKYALRPHIIFNSKIISAAWSKTTNTYTLVTVDPRTNPSVSRDLLDENSEGERKTYEVDFIVCATGVLEIPHWPDVEGLGTFKGEMFHSARWDWGVDLRGKKVCVIGNGSTTFVFLHLVL